MKLSVLFVSCLLQLRFSEARSQFGINNDNHTPDTHFQGQTNISGFENYSAQTKEYERMVTFLKGMRRVEHDLGYGQPNTTGKIISAPSCPTSLFGNPWLYYKTKHGVKCYWTKTKGPCETYQVFTHEPGSHYGYCNCFCSRGETGLTRNNDYRPQFCLTSETVFVPRRKSCFKLNTQAYCGKGYWLVKKGENQISCELSHSMKKFHLVKGDSGSRQSSFGLSITHCRKRRGINLFRTCAKNSLFNPDH